MTESLLEQNELLTLPSDQDASGRTLGDEELALLTEVIRSGTLTSTKGDFVRTLEGRFAHLVGVDCSISARTLRRRMKEIGLRCKRPRYVYSEKEPHRAQKKGRLSGN